MSPREVMGVNTMGHINNELARESKERAEE
jgi:hypothetical protein